MQATLLSCLTINLTKVIPPRYFPRSKMNTDQNFYSKLYLNVSYYLHYIFFAIVSIRYYSPYFQKILFPSAVVSYLSEVFLYPTWPTQSSIYFLKKLNFLGLWLAQHAQHSCLQKQRTRKCWHLYTT